MDRRPEAPLPISKPLAAWAPHDLGVHPSVGEGLPPYVERQHDHDLRSTLKNAHSSTSTVVVKGDSCTGKTRAAYEAAHAELADWTLLYPRSAASLLRAVTEQRIGPRTIIWLDDAQNLFHEDQGETAAAALLTLQDSLRHLAIIITIWSSDYDTLTRRTHGARGVAQRRALLGTDCCFSTPAEFTSTQIDEFSRQATDPHWAQAADSARDAHDLTQTLAAVVELLQRYRHPGDHAGKALVTAAVDLRRFGVREAIPLSMLIAAAPGYLSTRRLIDLSQPHWAQDATDWAQYASHGVCAALPAELHPGGVGTDPDRCALNDYLEQHISQERAFEAPPEQFWQAALASGLSGASLARIATHAFSRARFKIARDLYVEALKRQHTPAFEELCVLYSETGMILTQRGIDELLALAEPIDDDGASALHLGVQVSYAATGSAPAEYQDQSFALAESLFKRAAEAGHDLAASALQDLYEDLGMLDEAVAVTRQTPKPDLSLQVHPAALLHQAADGDADALDELKEIAHSGEPRWNALVESAFDVSSQMTRWPSRLRALGERELARRLLDRGFNAKIQGAVRMLLTFLDRPEDQDEAEAVLRAAAETDKGHLYELFMELWPQHGREALALLSRARRHRRYGAVLHVARALYKIPRGRRTAEDIARLLATRDGYAPAQYILARWLYEAVEGACGELPPLESIPEEVTEMLRAAAPRHQDARRLWGQLAGRNGRVEEARAALLAAIDSGDYMVVTHGEFGRYLFPNEPDRAAQLAMFGLTAQGKPHEPW
ncbi:hypothetical protein [Streptomyces sp. NPDC058695]|uniref:hypothetical protein n=1 Tax=Streptomyces sp. NPDC058695 TaxID=3346604 RepID=UPI003662B012